MRAIFYLNLLSRLVPITAAFVFAVSAANLTAKIWAYVILCGALVAAEYIGYGRPLQHCYQKQQKLIDEFLKKFVETAQLGSQRVKVRINVMLVRWSWFGGRHFYPFYPENMEGYPDASLHFPIARGCCGQVFAKETAEPHYFDLRRLTDEQKIKDFRLTKRMFRKTQHVNAIVCVPLFREVFTLRGNKSYRYFGVLNADAVDDPGAILLQDAQIQQQIKALAHWVQMILE